MELKLKIVIRINIFSITIILIIYDSLVLFIVNSLEITRYNFYFEIIIIKDFKDYRQIITNDSQCYSIFLLSLWIKQYVYYYDAWLRESCCKLE